MQDHAIAFLKGGSLCAEGVGNSSATFKGGSLCAVLAWLLF